MPWKNKHGAESNRMIKSAINLQLITNKGQNIKTAVSVVFCLFYTSLFSLSGDMFITTRLTTCLFCFLLLSPSPVLSLPRLTIFSETIMVNILGRISHSTMSICNYFLDLTLGHFSLFYCVCAYSHTDAASFPASLDIQSSFV